MSLRVELIVFLSATLNILLNFSTLQLLNFLLTNLNILLNSSTYQLLNLPTTAH